MATSVPKKRLATLTINGTAVEAAPGETVLQAALRGGVPFPNSCRVGGCGACKCRLVEGDVKELTETGYLLTKDEIDQRFILACQSVARSDVRVEVALAPARPTIEGRVAATRKLTHDITRLDVELARPLAYQAGQFATIGIDGLDAKRSYSFATPPAGANVTFFVRKVPGGLFSTLVNDEDVVGRAVTVEGPSGDLWLRPGPAPLLFVAGGSGLAPLLAMLEQALADGVTRPVTLLFGAREERDLYAQDTIAEIARLWPAPFRFVPVLSAAGEDTAPSFARGLVVDTIADAIAELRADGGGAPPHAYLCGPPAMIDAALPLLERHGVDRADVHVDRFTTRADVAPAEAELPAPARANDGPRTFGGRIVDVLHYAKFFSFHLVGLFSALAILAGGPYVTAGLALVLALYLVGDALGGDDTSTPVFERPALLTVQLWLALPLLAFIVFAAVWSVAPGDPLGFGAALSALSGYDVVAAREATSFGHHVSTWVLAGLMIGMIGTITGHELTHRTWDPISLFVGRWLLAFSFDTSFAIEHVYGHHRYVSTEEDPATAPRGRNVYVHIVASTLKGNASAWKIEAGRLAKKGLPVFSWHNAFLRGHTMSLVLVALAFAAGGLRTAGFFVAAALWGKALLEIVNYMEHYGLVRNPALPVKPRHSWNTNRRVSSWSLFNLTRHSHHHAEGEVPYHELRPYPDAPMMISGYLTTLVVAMIPPLWHHLMTPKVLAWDRDYASPEERALAKIANARSGLRAFEAGTLPSAVSRAHGAS